MSQNQAAEHDPTPTSWKSLQKVRIVNQDASSTAKRTPSPSGHMERAVRSEDNAPLEPYRSYKPRPFTREERDKVTVLFGGLHWRAERVIQGALENLGYRAQILPTATRDDLLTGREIADIGQCCPTSFTTGNLANFLRAEGQRIGIDEVAKKYVYVPPARAAPAASASITRAMSSRCATSACSLSGCFSSARTGSTRVPPTAAGSRSTCRSRSARCGPSW